MKLYILICLLMAVAIQASVVKREEGELFGFDFGFRPNDGERRPDDNDGRPEKPTDIHEHPGKPDKKPEHDHKGRAADKPKHDKKPEHNEHGNKPRSGDESRPYVEHRPQRPGHMGPPRHPRVYDHMVDFFERCMGRQYMQNREEEAACQAVRPVGQACRYHGGDPRLCTLFNIVRAYVRGVPRTRVLHPAEVMAHLIPAVVDHCLNEGNDSVSVPGELMELEAAICNVVHIVDYICMDEEMYHEGIDCKLFHALKISDGRRRPIRPVMDLARDVVNFAPFVIRQCRRHANVGHHNKTGNGTRERPDGPPEEACDIVHALDNLCQREEMHAAHSVGRPGGDRGGRPNERDMICHIYAMIIRHGRHHMHHPPMDDHMHPPPDMEHEEHKHRY